MQIQRLRRLISHLSRMGRQIRHPSTIIANDFRKDTPRHQQSSPWYAWLDSASIFSTLVRAGDNILKYYPLFFDLAFTA